MRHGTYGIKYHVHRRHGSVFTYEIRKNKSPAKFTNYVYTVHVCMACQVNYFQALFDKIAYQLKVLQRAVWIKDDALYICTCNYVQSRTYMYMYMYMYIRTSELSLCT